MKKVNFNDKNLTEMDGETPLYMRNAQGFIVSNEKDKEGNPIKLVRNLKETCVNLLANAQEENEEGTKKLDKFMLAQRIQLSKGAIELKAEDILMIKEVVGKYESPIIVGQVYKALGELK